MANGTGRLELGVLLRQGELRDGSNRVIGWGELRDMAQAAEGVGIDTLWIADHLLFRNAGSVVMDEGETRGVWEAFSLLSALAEATERSTLGPFVACNSFRNPALLAKIVDTLDEISGGRVLLGLGAGWHEPEYTAFGYPFDHLASRFDEALQVLVPLLKGEEVTFAGDYYQVKDCVLRPSGPRPGGPPIWIGASRPRMLRLVARYADAYNSVWHASPSELARPFANLGAACREVGRDPATIRRTAGANVIVPAMDDASGPPTALRGSVEEVARAIYAFKTEAGVTHLTFIMDPWTTEAIESFGRVVEAVRALEG
ncbi:MAG: LLM class flavin-dependent oxidoreductase [Chloroflexota bacterium]|nr:LLM class flavin-dependent oxidoreductase [Chloroflexota bacterium]